MTSKEFIIEALNTLVEVFPDVRCRVRFDTFCDTYYVEVVPSDYFTSSKELKGFRARLLMDFLDRYPDQSIVFTTEGRKVRFDTVDFQISGKAYLDQSIQIIHRSKYSKGSVEAPSFWGGVYPDVDVQFYHQEVFKVNVNNPQFFIHTTPTTHFRKHFVANCVASNYLDILGHVAVVGSSYNLKNLLAGEYNNGSAA